MNIYSQNIYEVVVKKVIKHVLIIYNISENHYVGITVHTTQSSDLCFLKSVNRFADIEDLQEYNKNNIKQPVYIKGKFLRVLDKEFSNVLNQLKASLINKIKNEINYKNIENLKYLKWCYDKLILNDNEFDISKLNPGCICWVEFGQNIGSELRKLRPAILWRSSSDKKMWTVIPLSSKCFNDKYYFHCDMSFLSYSTAKIESMTNLSYKRIREPFFYNKKIAVISKDDRTKIINSIQKYYLFEN